VMAAPIIFISSDSSEESVGFRALRRRWTCESRAAERYPQRHESLTPSSEFPLALIVSPPKIRMTFKRPLIPTASLHSTLPSSSSPSDHSLSGHTPPDTTDQRYSSTPQKNLFHRSTLLGFRDVVRAFRSEVIGFIFTSYRPSRKRCRSLTALSFLPSPTQKAIAAEEHMAVDTADAEVFVDVGVREDDEDLKVEASTADIREIDVDPLAIGDSFESSRGGIPDLEDTIYDIVHYMSEVRIDMITEIETTQRQLETSQLVASGERASLVERIGSLRLEYLKNMTITRSGMTPEAIEELVNRRVEEALAAYEATRAANALEAESQSQNGSDGDNGNGGNGNGGDGNGGNGNGGNGNPNENNRDARPVVRECTYQDFMKCQPLNFKGTEGVFGLIRWFEKM
ncbi:hypothetical protein Tco_0919289, partial [Tanacetum coccineum]